jgi:hypothetical protein
MTAVEFGGEEFLPREKTNRMRSLYLAKLARDGSSLKEGDEAVGEAVMSNMAALYDLVEHVLRPEDFDRFMAAADRAGADDTELYTFTAKMIAAAAERPTVLPADSSAGPSPMPVNSVSRLEELASERFAGRPDLYLAATASERATG